VTGCKVCDDIALKGGVDELLEGKAPYTQIARRMTARGFPVSADIVSSHDKHRHEYPTKSQTTIERRDVAAIIRDKMTQTIVAMNPGDMFEKDLQPALGTALKAQAIIDKRETKKPQQNFFIELYMGQRVGPAALLDDPNVIDGEATEVE
jgi:hypothetical protein